MRFNDLTLGLVVLLGAFAIFLSSLAVLADSRAGLWGGNDAQALIALLAAGTGFFMIGKALAAGERVPRIVAPPWTRSRRSIFGFFLTIALILAYILFSRALGFLPIAIRRHRRAHAGARRPAGERRSARFGPRRRRHPARLRPAAARAAAAKLPLRRSLGRCRWEPSQKPSRSSSSPTSCWSFSGRPASACSSARSPA